MNHAALTELIFNVTNIVIAIAALSVIIFIFSYSLLFDPTKTLAGKLVRNMMYGILGLCVLALTREPFQDQLIWALFRLMNWIYCGFVFASMVWLVFVRRFRVEGKKLVPVPDPVDPLHPVPSTSNDNPFRLKKH